MFTTIFNFMQAKVKIRSTLVSTFENWDLIVITLCWHAGAGGASTFSPETHQCLPGATSRFARSHINVLPAATSTFGPEPNQRFSRSHIIANKSYRKFF
jgi:hypothetical protein